MGEMLDARGAGTRACGGMSLVRLGFGAAKLTGPGVWGPPADPDQAVAVLRRAADLGVNLFDTADTYGPFVSEELIRRALHPYRDLIVATKGGCVHTGPDQWATLGDPAYLRQSCEMSLRRLGLETIDLYQLHEVDPRLPFEEQLGALIDLQRDGKIRHIGLSSVSIEQLGSARAMVEIVTVQGELNVLERAAEPTMHYCTDQGLGFIPFFPLADGRLARARGRLEMLARSLGVTTAQLVLAWLLHLSPAILPIPGTATIAELEENVLAASLELPDGIVAELSAGVALI
jgi:pyridoxine 4-dehydrogenase